MAQAWYPGPRYLLRQQCILRLLRGLPPGRVLEFGCAHGTLLRLLAERGFTGLGVDVSEEALGMAQQILAGLGGRMSAAPLGAEAGTGPYDYLMAFEVLEHIPDDRAALAAWRQFLRPGGRLLLSVPAHPEQWGPTDELAGHCRRYTRPGIRKLLEENRFSIDRFWCYGFPGANISQWFDARASRRMLAEHPGESLEVRNARSGIDCAPLRPYRWTWHNPLFGLASGLQMLFVGTDWGNGYIVRAQAV
jgi:SAM-dependent methyltransferase